MQFKKLLAPVMLGALFGLTACDSGSGTSATPTPVPVSSAATQVPVTPTSSAAATVALSPTANIVYPASLYAGWKAAHYVTLEEEEIYYSDLKSEFYEGVFRSPAYLPAARVKWSAQSPGGYYGDLCSVSTSSITQMKFRACTVSEGIGYGMLITLFAEDYEAFNRLWNYSKAFRAYSNVKLTPWITRSFHYQEVDVSSATDADLDIATALILAYLKTGAEAYLTDALTIAWAIWDQEVNKSNYLLYSGNTSMWTLGDPAYNLSYFSPVALRLFAAIDQTHDWNTVLNSMYTYMLTVQASGTGVFPDWSNGAGIPVDPENGSAKKTYWTFNKEAVRIPWRIAWDYLWYNSIDTRAATVLTNLNNFIVAKTGGDPNSALLAYNYSANLSAGADISGTTVQTHWYGAWCVTSIASNPNWLQACTDTFNAKAMLNNSSSYFLDILQMMMSQLLNGAYVKPY